MTENEINSFHNLDILENCGKKRSYKIAKELEKKHEVFILMPDIRVIDKRKVTNLKVLWLAFKRDFNIRKYFSYISKGIKFFEKNINK